jgi:hypothetical protein
MRGIVAARGTVDGQAQPPFAPRLGNEVRDAVIERSQCLAGMTRDLDFLGSRHRGLFEKLKSVLAVQSQIEKEQLECRGPN